MISRFAPSTTGEPHPGTLMSALLVWLDARARGGRAVLRLEDLDTTRVKATFADSLVEAMSWLGLTWDETVIQSGRQAAHEAALDDLAARGVLYPCTCSRSSRAGGRRAPDGGWAYPNTCRGKRLPAGGWRAVDDNLRVQLPDAHINLVDRLGVDLSQNPAQEMGDPIVRRRDGVIAYQLAVVVDDGAAGITDIVRGRDIAPSTATQILLQQLLGLPTPAYFHHFLLLEPAGEKLAKLHGSIPFSQVRGHYSAEELTGWLAHVAGLEHSVVGTTPQTLVERFDWMKVPRADRIVRWKPDRGLYVE